MEVGIEKEIIVLFLGNEVKTMRDETNQIKVVDGEGREKNEEMGSVCDA